MIYVASGTTENYLHKAEPFINSMSVLSSEIGKIVITLGFEVSNEFKAKYPKVRFIFQDRKPLENELTKINCLQHGAFMDVLDFVENDDMIIFSDGDVIIQRDLTQTEMDFLDTFTNNNIGCNMNNWKARSLESDFSLLVPKVPIGYLSNYFYHINLDKCNGYNTGFLVARPQAWKDLRDIYKKHFEFTDGTCEHYAKQQLLINIVSHLYFEIIEMEQSWHTHGHFGLPPYAHYDNGTLKIGDEIVIFRHFL